jgi:hypothetical protein
MTPEHSDTDRGESHEMSDTDDAPTAGPNEDTQGITGHDTLLLKGTLGLLSVLAIVATIRLYLSVSNAIGIWVTHEFRPLAQAGFNLVVLIVVGAGISIVIRRLHAS